MMQVYFDTKSVESYHLFLKVKSLPSFRIQGHTAEFPDEYASRLGLNAPPQVSVPYSPKLQPPYRLYDYQEAIVRMALNKQKFDLFVEPGLGKTLMYLEYMRHVREELKPGQDCLLIAPLMVVDQTMEEVARFYGDSYGLERIKSADLQSWLDCDTADRRIGITNYEALKHHIDRKRVKCLGCDEFSLAKSAYGKYSRECIRLGKGLHWKIAGTGTPAPNDRIEYGSQAVFMDQFPTLNAFLSKFFVNKGQTQERWTLKPYALESFYRSLSHWSIFLTNPSTYGWKDNVGTIPPIHVHYHDVPLTPEQEKLAYGRMGTLFAHKIGGITNRTALSTIAKGYYKGQAVPTNKPQAIRDLIGTWRGEESTLVWCLYDKEQDSIEAALPDAASIRGSTKLETRLEVISDFKAGTRTELVSKAKILGFGLNLQKATRQVFSGLMDSYELFWQAVKRSNRVGSTHDLNIHIPATEIEEPMIANVLRKMRNIEADTRFQEETFRRVMA